MHTDLLYTQGNRQDERRTVYGAVLNHPVASVQCVSVFVVY